jgi:hypothetical protein
VTGFDISEVLGDPRWQKVAQNPDALNAAMGRLFDTWQANSPGNLQAFEEMEPEKQEATRQEFFRRVRKKYPDAFPVPAAAAKLEQEVEDELAFPDFSKYQTLKYDPVPDPPGFQRVFAQGNLQVPEWQAPTVGEVLGRVNLSEGIMRAFLGANEALDDQIPSADQIKAAWRRGANQGQQMIASQQLEYNPANQEAAWALVELRKESGDVPTSPEYAAFQTDDFAQAAKAFAKNPLAVTSELIAESLGNLLPAVVQNVPAGVAAGAGAGSVIPLVGTSAGALAGLAAGTGGASLSVEYAGKLLESLEKAGVNLDDPKDVQRGFTDPKIMSKARSLAWRRGLTVGMFDAASVLIGAKVVEKPAIGLFNKLAAAGKEAGKQAGMGMAGEAAGQVAAGERFNPVAVFAEGLAEVGSGAAETAGGAMLQASGMRERGRVPKVGKKEEPDFQPLEDQLPDTGKIEEGPVQGVPVGEADLTDVTEAGPADLEGLPEGFVESYQAHADAWVRMAPPGAENIRWLDTDSLKLSKDVPNFKRGADPRTGVVEGQKLGGEYDVGAAGIIQVWERKNGDLEVISGRHRRDLAVRTGYPKMLAEVFREEDGFTAEDAAVMDAEKNILDGKGDLDDYVQFFKGSNISEPEARDKGLLARALGRKSFAIASYLSPDSFALWQSGKLNTDAAAEIAEAAPLDTDLQREAVYMLGRDSKLSPKHFIQSRKAFPTAKKAGAQGDLFGTSDQALNDSIARANAAQKFVEEMKNKIRAAIGALKRPEAAAEMGVNFKDEKETLAEIDRLRAEIADWEHWGSDPAKVALASARAGLIDTPSPPSAAAPFMGNHEKTTPGGAPGANLLKEQQDLFGMAAGPSPFRRLLQDVAAKPMPTASTAVQVLESREMQRQAVNLLEDLAAGRMTEDEAQAKWTRIGAAVARRDTMRAKAAAARGAGRQTDLFAAPESQGSLFEPVAAFAAKNGVKNPARAGQALADTLAQLELPGLHEPYRAPAPPPMTAEEANAAAIANPRNARALREAFRMSQGVRWVLRDLVDGRIPAFNVAGQVVRDAADVAAMMIPARSPDFESSKVVAVRDGRVVACELVSMGELNATLMSSDMVMRVMNKIEGPVDGVWISHNHPSGDPAPSSEDILLTKKMKQELDRSGIKLLGHVVTNGENFVEITPEIDYNAGEISNKSLAPWEAVESSKKWIVRTPENARPIIGALRQADPGYGHVMVLDTKNRVNALERIPIDIPQNEVGPLLAKIVSRNSGVGMVIEIPGKAIQYTGLVQQIKRLAESSPHAKILDVLTLDGANGEVWSAREQGVIAFHEGRMETVREAPGGWVFEKPVERWDPRPDLGTPAPRVPKPGDDPNPAPYAMELPELLELARAINGRETPEVRKFLRNAYGHFRHIPGQLDSGKIRLRADIFQLIMPDELEKMQTQANKDALAQASIEFGEGFDPENMTKEQADFVGGVAQRRFEFFWDTTREKRMQETTRQAARTLSHEIGHMADFNPEGIIRGRGNILARIATFQQYFRRWLGETPAKQGNVFTKKELQKLRRDAEKMVGPRPPKDEEADLAAWQDAVRKQYAELRDEQEEMRGLLNRDKVRQELEDLIAWWRGIEPGGQVPEYFLQGHEMYAEAFSVILTNPAAMATRAPQFWNAFNAWLDRKPLVRAQWQRIQNELKTGAAHKNRRLRLLEGFQKSDADWMDLKFTPSFWKSLAGGDTSAAKAKAEMAADMLIYGFDRTLGPIYRRLPKLPEERRGQVMKALADFRYKAAQSELVMAELNQRVGGVLLEHGLDMANLGEYMFYQHILHNRADVANPGATDPKAAADGLESMLESLGRQRFDALERARLEFRAIYEKYVLGTLRDFEILTPELQAVLEERVYYATFAVVRGDVSAKEGTIEFELARMYGDAAGSQIYRQVGTLQDIMNPASALAAKALSLINMAHREHAKRLSAEALLEIKDPMVARAPNVWDGTRQIPKVEQSENVQTLTYLHKGKLHGVYVPRSIYAGLQHGDTIENRMMAGMAKYLNRPIKGVMTEINYGFWPVAFVRDMFAFARKMPKAALFGRRGFWKYFARSWAASRSGIHGRPNEIAKDALMRNDLISVANPQGLSDVDTVYERLLNNWHQNPVLWRRSAVSPGARLLRLWDKWTQIGQISERTFKIAGMLYLDEHFSNLPEWKKQNMVHNLAGSPDFLDKPAFNPVIELFSAMYYNPWKQSVRSEVKAFKEGWASYIWHQLKYAFLPKAIQFALFTGGLRMILGKWLSDKMEEAGRYIGDYDQTNYVNTPLGWQDMKSGKFSWIWEETPAGPKKLVYHRMPLDEGQRMMGGAFWLMLNRLSDTGRGAQGIGSYAGGQVPTQNPISKVAVDWYAYKLLDRNPYDRFRGELLLRDDVFAARDLSKDADGAMARYAWNSLGGGIVTRLQADNWYMRDAKAPPMEKFLNLPIVSNSIGRWIKISDRGLYDSVKGPIMDARAQGAAGRLEVQKALAEPDATRGAALQGAVKKYPAAAPYLMNQASKGGGYMPPDVRALMNAQSTAEKVAIEEAMEKAKAGR